MRSAYLTCSWRGIIQPPRWQTSSWPKCLSRAQRRQCSTFPIRKVRCWRAPAITVGKAKLRRGRKHAHTFAAKRGRRLENDDLLVRIEEFKGGRVGSFEHVLASFTMGQHRLAGGLD